MSTKINTKNWSKKAMKLLGLAANGVPEAQYELAVCYLEGKGITKNDTLAIDWLFKAASQGNEDANYMLYNCYTNGVAVNQNHKIALGFLVKAAEGTNKYAQFDLADYYMGRSQYELALDWYKKSARQEYAPAQCELGRCYFYGIGTFKAEEVGKDWLERASEKNYPQALDLLNKIDRLA